MPLELFASPSCPYCDQVREYLELDGAEFVEYDVEADPHARIRLRELTGGAAMVPVVVEDGRVTQVGVGGRGCYVSGP